MLQAKALLAVVLWRTRHTQVAVEDAAAAANVMAQQLLHDTWSGRTRVGRSPFTSALPLGSVGNRVPMRFNLNPAFAATVITFSGDTLLDGARYHSQNGTNPPNPARRKERTIGRSFDELWEFCSIVGLPLAAVGETEHTWDQIRPLRTLSYG